VPQAHDSSHKCTGTLRVKSNTDDGNDDGNDDGHGKGSRNGYGHNGKVFCY